MKSPLPWIKQNRLKAGLIGGGIVLVLLIGSALGGGNGNHETILVERRDVIEEVKVAGTVEARIVSELGFESSGVVREVLVDVNDAVGRGQRLASLSLGTLGAELQSAQAQVAIKRAEATNTGVNLEAIKEQYDTRVENARTELYSDDLAAEPQSTTYTQTPPTITGRYDGEPGTYKIRIARKVVNGDPYLYVFDLEDGIEPREINDTSATPLGTKGLFIDFSDTLDSYEDTTWYIRIPNEQGASYAANFSAYQDALRDRERAIDEAEAELRSQGTGGSIAQAELAAAQADVARIQALIAQRVLTAPFSGIVTAVEIDPGESVSANDPAISLISNDGFGIEVDLPEIDSIKVRNGNKAIITLDAFGEEELMGTVASVNRTETLVDGISVYEGRIAFDDESDERIASGMTAEVSIITNERPNVLALPARAIRFRDDGTAYVVVDTDGEETEVEIAQGLRGSDGYVEIMAGLDEGAMIVLPQ